MEPLVSAPTVAPASGPEADAIQVSIVVPVFNESESLPFLHKALVAALEDLGRTWEILYCDDGSTDGSYDHLRTFAADEPRVRVIRFRRNFGQTAAMSAGFDHARADVIIPIDADLQNDPADIGLLLEKIDEGFDVASGWRHKRADALFSVTLPSRVGNWIIGGVTGVKLHDYGCTLTAYRREVVGSFRLYGEMHRFLPAWAASVGASICEVKVSHKPRKWGQSKYNIGKAWRVILDLLTVRFLIAYSTKPLYFFGRLGFRFLFLAGASWTWTLTKKLQWGEPLYTDPFFLAGIFLGLAGLQILLIGLLAELNMRTYYESQDKRIYTIRDSIHLE
jgi:glycosyltransferase involved in cell wall biosynthesis